MNTWIQINFNWELAPISHSSHWTTQLPAGGTKPPKSDLRLTWIPYSESWNPFHTRTSSSTKTDSGRFIKLTRMPFLCDLNFLELLTTSSWEFTVSQVVGANQKRKGNASLWRKQQNSPSWDWRVSAKAPTSLRESDFQTDIQKMTRNEKLKNEKQYVPERKQHTRAPWEGKVWINGKAKRQQCVCMSGWGYCVIHQSIMLKSLGSGALADVLADLKSLLHWEKWMECLPLETRVKNKWL